MQNMINDLQQVQHTLQEYMSSYGQYLTTSNPSEDMQYDASQFVQDFTPERLSKILTTKTKTSIRINPTGLATYHRNINHLALVNVTAFSKDGTVLGTGLGTISFSSDGQEVDSM